MSAPGEPLAEQAGPLVSLIVVSYNSAALLPACCAALLRTEHAPIELIVVDNASTDGSLAALDPFGQQLRVIASAANLGFGRACNLGAQAAQGELLVFLNPDVIVPPGWLAPLVRHMDEHPAAAILCPQTVAPGTIWHPPAPDRPQVAPTAAVPGCALTIRRAAWQQLGGFDGQIFLYWEDTELCWRAWLAGWEVLEDLAARVEHERGGSAGGRRWDAEQTKNSLYTYLKLMRWRRVVPFASLLLIKTLAKALLHRSPGLWGAWGWNLRQLGLTLARRRALLAARRIDQGKLERLIDAHQRRQRRERRQRRSMHQ